MSKYPPWIQGISTSQHSILCSKSFVSETHIEIHITYLISFHSPNVLRDRNLVPILQIWKQKLCKGVAQCAEVWHLTLHLLKCCSLSLPSSPFLLCVHMCVKDGCMTNLDLFQFKLNLQFIIYLSLRIRQIKVLCRQDPENMILMRPRTWHVVRAQ